MVSNYNIVRLLCVDDPATENLNPMGWTSLKKLHGAYVCLGPTSCRAYRRGGWGWTKDQMSEMNVARKIPQRRKIQGGFPLVKSTLYVLHEPRGPDETSLVFTI